jgi:hypothetical protein
MDPMIPSMLIATPRHQPMEDPSFSSVWVISAENRFKIRPMGVVSKNDTGAARMRFSNVRCILRDALTPNAMVKIDRRQVPAR